MGSPAMPCQACSNSRSYKLVIRAKIHKEALIYDVCTAYVEGDSDAIMCAWYCRVVSLHLKRLCEGSISTYYI